MVKIHRDPIYLEVRRQQLVNQIRALTASPGPVLPRKLRIRRRQKSLNLINKRLGT